MENIIWLSILGAGLALDYAMMGQFMLSQPLVLGGIFGFIFGDVYTGLLVGALVQLLWIGVVPMGAYIPADYSVIGGITIILTEILLQQSKTSLEVAMVLALSVAIPAGFISGRLDIAVRNLNSHLAKNIYKVVDNYGLSGITWINLAGLIPSFLRNFIVYLIWLGPVNLLLIKIINKISLPLEEAMQIIFWLLPALSFAVLLDIIFKDKVHWWVIGSYVIAGVLLIFWPKVIMLVLVISIILASGVSIWKKNW